MKLLRSIRLKYTVIFVGIWAAVLLAVFLVMNFGLTQYIAMTKKDAIKSTIEQITSIEENDGWSDDGTFELMRIASMNNFGINVYSVEGTNPVQIFSTNFNLDTVRQRFDMYLNNEDVQVDKIEEKTDEYAIYRIYDYRLGSQQIECMGHTDDIAYVITTSMKGISETVSASNTFLIYAGIFGTVILIIAAYFVCKKITKPIVDLAKQSEQISNLDFTGKYTGSSNDEIGILGNNVNNMSERLEKTINELYSANEKLAQDIEEKEKVNQMQREFIANVSHELKTPIALISGFAEGLKEGIADDPDSAAYYTDVIADEADKMGVIVKRLLNLDEIESGRLEPSMEEFDIVSVLKGVISSTSFLSKDKAAKVTLSAPESINVFADEFMIEQVISNYLSNACHHVSDGGSIEVKADDLDSIVKVSVANTGEHIPEEDLDRIWEKFYKVDKAHTRSYGGSGIGLSIVKTIVSLHKGECYVRNTDTGVEFSFVIPKEQ